MKKHLIETEIDEGISLFSGDYLHPLFSIIENKPTEHDYLCFKACSSAATGDIDGLKELLKKDFNFNSRIEKGLHSIYNKTLDTTPLHWAAAKDQSKAIKFLVKHGAKLDVKDRLGLTPKDYAMYLDKEKALKTIEKMSL